jgi:hypothetical protein
MLPIFRVVDSYPTRGIYYWLHLFFAKINKLNEYGKVFLPVCLLTCRRLHFWNYLKILMIINTGLYTKQMAGLPRDGLTVWKICIWYKVIISSGCVKLYVIYLINILRNTVTNSLSLAWLTLQPLICVCGKRTLTSGRSKECIQEIYLDYSKSKYIYEPVV